MWGTSLKGMSRSADGSLGSPITRSLTLLRWTSEVPAAIVVSEGVKLVQPLAFLGMIWTPRDRTLPASRRARSDAL